MKGHENHRDEEFIKEAMERTAERNEKVIGH